MPSIVFYLQVHQPFRLRRYSVFDTGGEYFDDRLNAEICRKVARKCYLPANRAMKDIIRRHGERFAVNFSLTGVAVEQFRRWAPEVLDSFVELNETGRVEFLAETYYHTLAFLYDRHEFAEQVRMHVELMEGLFDRRPAAFRNTELTYNNDLPQLIRPLGFTTIITEGAPQVLGARSPSRVYRPHDGSDIKILLKNSRLSDDVAFRFSTTYWEHYPLTVDKFAQWVDAALSDGCACNLFMDYETFGEHHWAETGIFEFLHAMPEKIIATGRHAFETVSAAAARHQPEDELDVPETISWADTERDISAWLGNSMQIQALEDLYSLGPKVLAAGDERLRDDWRKLQTSDHFYYMSTKWLGDGVVHKYFTPYESPYDAFINYMNVLDHLRGRIK